MAGDGDTAKKLTLRELRFLEEYLTGFNATAAYRRVFPKAAYHTARANAARLLAKGSIRNRLRSLRRTVERRTAATQERVVLELSRIAFSDIGDVLDFSRSDGLAIRPGSAIAPDARRALASMKVKRTVERVPATVKGKRTTEPMTVEVIEFKFHDKNAALEKLCRVMGLYKDLPPLPPLEEMLQGLPPKIAAACRVAIRTAMQDGKADADFLPDNGRGPTRSEVR